MNFCHLENCGKPVHSRGLCKSHYRLYIKYGTFEKVKKGDRVVHPLYDTWRANKARNEFVKEWADDFWKFVKDVGGKKEDFRFTRIRLTEPYGPNNFEWVPLFKALEGETDKDRRKRQRSQKRIDDPNFYRALNLKFLFRLSLEEAELKLKAQNFVCAICEKPETTINAKTGLVINLALDHCHTTGKIRDFLCQDCNLFLGKIEQSPDRVAKHLAYIEKHK